MKIPFLFPCVSALSPEDDLASMSALLSPISRFWGTKLVPAGLLTPVWSSPEASAYNIKLRKLESKKVPKTVSMNT